MAIITLTTDFGGVDSYVAQMKGVILGIAPSATIVDVTHEIPAQDVRRAAAVVVDLVEAFPPARFMWRSSIRESGETGPWWESKPPDKVFWDRTMGYGAGWRPATPVSRRASGSTELWRPSVSATFHGRDILARLRLGWRWGLISRRREVLFRSTVPGDRWCSTGYRGRCERRREWLACGVGRSVRQPDHRHSRRLVAPAPGEGVTVEIGPVRMDVLSRCYAHLEEGELGALVSSNGCLEIAVRNGDAAKETGIGAGAAVRVRIPTRMV